MSYVIVEGRGTYRVGNWKFKLGATECDDPEILESVRNSGLDWISVRDDRAKETAPPEPEPEPEPEERPEIFTKFSGRDGKFYFVRPAGKGQTEQVGPFDTEDEADAAIGAAVDEATKIPLADDEKRIAEVTEDSGTLTKEDLERTEWPCETCGKVLKSRGARSTHERLKHPDNSEPEQQ